ncbi:MAG: NAD(P)-dependent glycerol-3-phosphate dehydrogenase [Alphaproteobacteria bacterium]|nr:NAD(P)-dependent glycerol-3-phosphate dehydrogenase [Alphaproteobacteria bacterium]
MMRIGIVGAGAWGTALAQVIRRQGKETVLYAREPEVIKTIRETSENTIYLPGIKLDSGIDATDALDVVADADALLLTTPAQYLRQTTESLARYLTDNTPVVICAKGIEEKSGALMSEIIGATLPEAPLAVLSGPTFAAEVARGLPTAATLASRDKVAGKKLLAILGSPRFRTYLSDDVIGAQIGGAVKNVLAIACGIVEGRRLGENARAALITRGLAEILRLGVALGGHPKTFMGLSGLGDLTLTCNSRQSRNLSLGVALGEGKPLKEILAGRKFVTEGVYTARAIPELAKRHGLEMPIADAVCDVLHRGADIDLTIAGLLARPLGEELPDGIGFS